MATNTTNPVRGLGRNGRTVFWLLAAGPATIDQMPRYLTRALHRDQLREAVRGLRRRGLAEVDERGDLVGTWSITQLGVDHMDELHELDLAAADRLELAAA